VLPPKGQQKEYGSTESIIILLKPYTFKKLCMLSKTKKAEEVRDYYIKLEELIDEYKSIIINNFQKKLIFYKMRHLLYDYYDV